MTLIEYGPATRPAPRHPDVSTRCHRAATVASCSAEHKACDGRSYTPSILSRGVPCICTCHRPSEDTECSA